MARKSPRSGTPNPDPEPAILKSEGPSKHGGTIETFAAVRHKNQRPQSCVDAFLCPVVCPAGVAPSCVLLFVLSPEF